jgi:hypothetical protein
VVAPPVGQGRTGGGPVIDGGGDEGCRVRKGELKGGGGRAAWQPGLVEEAGGWCSKMDMVIWPNGFYRFIAYPPSTRSIGVPSCTPPPPPANRGQSILCSKSRKHLISQLQTPMIRVTT